MGQAGYESGPSSRVPSFQTWLLLKPQLLYLYSGVGWAGRGLLVIYKKGAELGVQEDLWKCPLPFSSQASQM